VDGERRQRCRTTDRRRTSLAAAAHSFCIRYYSRAVEVSLFKSALLLAPLVSQKVTILSLLLDWSCQQLSTCEKGSVQELWRPWGCKFGLVYDFAVEVSRSVQVTSHIRVSFGRVFQSPFVVLFPFVVVVVPPYHTTVVPPLFPHAL
jgi:hypothetical protein